MHFEVRTNKISTFYELAEKSKFPTQYTLQVVTNLMVGFANRVCLLNRTKRPWPLQAWKDWGRHENTQVKATGVRAMFWTSNLLNKKHSANTDLQLFVQCIAYRNKLTDWQGIETCFLQFTHQGLVNVDWDMYFKNVTKSRVQNIPEQSVDKPDVSSLSLNTIRDILTLQWNNHKFAWL
jgi:hypothetical protein